MPEIRVQELAERTGMSVRYWQRRIASGEVPGCSSLDCGKRRMFLIDSDTFDVWWKSRKSPICQKISESAALHGGTDSAKTAKIRKARLKQTASPSLVNDLRKFVDA